MGWRFNLPSLDPDKLHGLNNLSDVYTYRSQTKTTITLTKKIYYYGSFYSYSDGEASITFDFKPLININVGIEHVIDNIDTAYFYHPPEFGWVHNSDYYLAKTPITVLSGKEKAAGWGNTDWNKNGDWVSQTCKFEVTTEPWKVNSLSSANKYDRFLVLLEKIK